MSNPSRTAPLARRDLIHIGARKRCLSYGLYLAAALLRLRNSRQANPGKRVLILEPFGLGDVITFEPLVRELAANDFETIFCSKPEWKELLPPTKNLSWFNLKLPWATHNEQAKYRLSSYFSPGFRENQRQLSPLARGATGIDARGDIRSVLFLYLAGCKRVVSLSNYLGSDLKMWKTAAELVPFRNDLRRWELNLHFLKSVGLPVNPQVSSPRLNHLIAPDRQKRIALVPIAPWKGKLWQPSNWQSLVEQLRSQGHGLVGLCGPNQTAEAKAHLGSAVPITECNSIRAWADQFNRCRLVVTVDSGPMHLADGLGVPVIALFGQGKLPLWAPSGPHSVILTHQEDPDFAVCHPIDANIPLGQKFMDRISVSEVLNAVAKATAANRVEQIA